MTTRPVVERAEPPIVVAKRLGLECGKCAYLSWVGLLDLAVAAYWKNRPRETT